MLKSRLNPTREKTAMILGIDIGSSAVKLAGLEGDNVLFTEMLERRGCNVSDTFNKLVIREGIEDSLTCVAITGVGAEEFTQLSERYPVKLIPEIEATGEGGTWLSGVSDAVVVSLGTGTSLVLAKGGTYSHVGGTGVGSGTVRGLAKKLTGCTDLPEYFALAREGDLRKIDIQIGDLFSGTDTLPRDLTASNLARCGDEGSDADWAAAVINMVLEVAGSHAALACGGYGVDTAVITGGLSQTATAVWCYEKFDRLYKPTYIIPPYSGFATAIGAARRAYLGA